MAKPYPTKICRVCDLGFSPPKKSSVLCSQECVAKWASICNKGKRKPSVWETRKCKNCQKDFDVKLSAEKAEIKNGQPPRGCCSRPCAYALRRNSRQPETRKCSKCERVFEFSKKFFPALKKMKHGIGTICRECTNKYAKTINKPERDALRIIVLTEYSKDKQLGCSCCGEKTVEFLTLDHIYGGGQEERKKYPATSLFRRLRKLGFPQGQHRTLCYNCNCCLGRYGYCPHQTKAHETESDASSPLSPAPTSPHPES